MNNIIMKLFLDGYTDGEIKVEVIQGQGLTCMHGMVRRKPIH